MRVSLRIAVAVLATGSLAATVTGCAAGQGSGSSGPTGPSGSSTPMSSSELPTTPRPTGPPSGPSDAKAAGTVAGRVSATSDGCHDVVTDDGTTWSLIGPVDQEVAVGDSVLVKIETASPGDASCGTGTPARIVSLQIVR
ncbi:hypothetical protein [Microbacterium sp. P03]|uniref:hypothetical protein n=1 Tax=Microbacterium sp. P03 TaxID=3366946 RepID=UPI0037473372